MPYVSVRPPAHVFARRALVCAVVVVVFEARPLSAGPVLKTETSTTARAATPAATAMTAGFSQGSFFIRSADGSFRFSPSLRLQIDGYAFGPEFRGLGQPRASVFVRRARPELFGTLFAGRVQFMLGGDFAEAQNGATATDVFLIFNFNPLFRLQVGQFDLPFSQENRTSDRYIEFLERSLVVRNLGTANKEPGLMVFGALREQRVHYAVGVFTGNGINVRNLDNAWDVVGRAFYRPLAGHPRWGRAQVGGSFQWGTRRRTNQPFVSGAGPADGGWLTTSGGYPFFVTRYPAADGSDTPIGVVPEGTVARQAVEVSVPVGPFVLRSEYIHFRADADENILTVGAPIRAGGTIDAHGVYVLGSYWVFGDPRILPDAGIQAAPFFDATGRPPEGAFHLQVSVRFDFLDVDYEAGAVQGTSLLGPSLVEDGYQLWDVALGANLWWSRHVRFSVNYIFNRVRASAANLPAADQDFLHELGFRVALAL